MHRRTARPLAPFALAAALLAGCIPSGDGVRDGVVGAPVEQSTRGVSIDFVWPGDGVATDEGLRFADADADVLRLKVRVENPHPHPVIVDLDDLVMRPHPDPGEDGESEGLIEAVYPAPGALHLEAGASRTLDFGSVQLFFGFACTVHVTGEITPLRSAGALEPVAVSHDSPPILVDL